MRGWLTSFIVLSLFLATAWFYSTKTAALGDATSLEPHSAAAAAALLLPQSPSEPGPGAAPLLQNEPGTSGVTSVSASLKDLLDLKDCYKRDCDFPRTDPRSYDLAVGKALKNSLETLASSVRSQRLEDQQLAETAREMLNVDDGNVKEGALDLLATQPTSDENLHAVLNDVIDNSDAELVSQALLELERYAASGDRKIIDHALANSLLHGSPFVATAISERMGPLLNSSNKTFYRTVADEMDAQSLIRRNLLSRIDEVAR